MRRYNTQTKLLPSRARHNRRMDRGSSMVSVIGLGAALGVLFLFGKVAAGVL